LKKTWQKKGEDNYKASVLSWKKLQLQKKKQQLREVEILINSLGTDYKTM